MPLTEKSLESLLKDYASAFPDKASPKIDFVIKNKPENTSNKKTKTSTPILTFTPFKLLLFYIIHHNQFHLLDFLLERNEEILNYLKSQEFAYFLNSECDQSFPEDYKRTDVLSYAITHNSAEVVKSLVDAAWKCDTEHLKLAISCHAEKTFDVLFLKVRPWFVKDLAEHAKNIGNVYCLLKLQPDDLYYYFSDFTKKLGNKSPWTTEELEDFYFLIAKSLRYSSVDTVRMLCNSYFNHLDPSNPQVGKLKAQADKAFSDFPTWGSQITRYRKPRDLHQLKRSYKSQNHIRSEKDFGDANFAIIQSILQGEAKIPDTGNKFQAFPIYPPPENFPYSMLDLLKYFSEAHYEEANRRNNNETAELFRKVCIDYGNNHRSVCTTPADLCRYDHMIPFIEETHRQHEKIEPVNYSTSARGYTLIYKDHLMTEVLIKNSLAEYPWEYIWEHGKTSFSYIWPDIETYHKKIFEMDAKSITENPKEFYDDVITTIWLMGNLYPMERGTGRYVEQWLALAHAKHGLPIPILKPGFQLDCLDLTFDLETYKNLFLHFVEPSTLTPVAQTLVSETSTLPNLKEYIELIKLKTPPKISINESAHRPWWMSAAVTLGGTLGKITDSIRNTTQKEKPTVVVNASVDPEKEKQTLSVHGSSLLNQFIQSTTSSSPSTPSNHQTNTEAVQKISSVPTTPETTSSNKPTRTY